MADRRNYYRLLQVQPDAPIEIIRASYRALMRDLKRHPDLGGSHQEALALTEAYQVLSDPEKRAAYDRELFRRYDKRSVGMGEAGRRAHSRPAEHHCPFCKHPLARAPQPTDRCPNCKSPVGTFRAEKCRRRAEPRVKKSGKLRYYTAWPQKGREAALVDVSPHGMRFLCDERLPKGQTLKICTPFLRCIGQVVDVRKRPTREGVKYSVGIRFLTVLCMQERGGFFSGKV